MLIPALVRDQGRRHFDAMSRGYLLRELSAVLTGRSRTLLPLKDVVRAAGMDGQVDRGEQEIPLDRIRGSENRARDFDAGFNPLKAYLRERWVRLYMAMAQGEGMPPIDVYQVGEVYFVKDGHHRVSVARRLGWETISAHVVEVRTRAPLSPDVDCEDLLRVAEYASFLERTQLDRVRPEARLQCSQLGRYDVIFEHILGHRYFLGIDEGRDVSMPEAAASWYDLVYLPVMAVAERHQLASHLPGWTEADIYLALTRLWLDLDQEGRPSGPESAAEALLDEAAPSAGRGSGRRPRWLRGRPRPPGPGGGSPPRRLPLDWAAGLSPRRRARSPRSRRD